MGAALRISDQDEGLTPRGYALPPNGPVPALTKRIVELLRIGSADLVIDLCCWDPSALAILDDVRRRSQVDAERPFGERLARLIATSGVRTVQMDGLAFGRFPMRYEKVLLRGGFSRFRDRFREQLAPLLERLDAGARFLVVDSAPSPDAPLFAEGLRRWEREHCPAEAIASVVEQAGFATRIDVLSCVRHVLTADCRAWIASRGWPILAPFSEAQLQGGLWELERRYGSQRAVKFTSRFELVLGTKPDALADQRTPSLPVSASIRA